MNKFRENTGVILWILVISFGVIWTLQDSGGLDTIGQPSDNLAVVNGAPITYEEYQSALESQRRRFQAQMDGDISPQMQDMMQQQTYDQLIRSKLLEQEMDRIGLTVTDDEVEDMILGPNPHPFIRQRFSDSTGQVNRQLIRNIAQSRPQQMRQLESYLSDQRRRQKMQNLVNATVRISEQDVLEAYQRRNTSANTRYVAKRYASVPDDSVTVTTSDLRNYYDTNREDYRQPKTYSLEYVTKRKAPTAEDTAAVVEDLEGLRDEFVAAENDSTFLAENASERDYTGSYSTADELETSIADALFPNPEPGRVVGPLFAGGSAQLVKVKDTRPADETVVHARHILLRSSEANPEVRQRAEQLRDSLRAGFDFGRLAREYSDDSGSASEGGDLGWFGSGRMAEAFEEAAFDAPIGQVVGPVKTQFGYHLIEVVARAEQEVLTANMAYALRPSEATLQDIRTELGDIAYFAEEGSEFEQEAQTRGLETRTVQVEAEQNSIPGLGQSRAAMTFMENAETGAISDVIELDNQYAVLRLVEVQPERYRPFEDVRSEIRPQVMLQKKRDVVRRQLEQARRQHSDLERVAQAVGATVRTKNNVKYDTNVVSGIGRDPSFAGAVFGLNEGATSGVVTGENAAFVVQVTALDTPPPISDSERTQIRQELLQQQRRQILQQWVSSLRDKANIVDNRSQFNL